ncbi:MAG: 30S ribosomal protein S7 [Promethearchaeota archaeon]
MPKDEEKLEADPEGGAADQEQPGEENNKHDRKGSTSKGKQGEVLLFNKWSWENIEVSDMGLEMYINLEPKIVPHTGGRHEHKRFWKTNITIVERFVNKILSPGLIGRRIKGRKSSHQSGKKQKVLDIVEKAFTLVELKTGVNPIQVLVDAVVNAAPREETTRITLGGISYQQAVDIAPQRRIDIAVKNIVQAAIRTTYNSVKAIEECYADELIAAGSNNVNQSAALKRKDEIERIAVSAR